MASNAQTELQSSALRSELPLLEPANVAYRGTTWYQEVTPRFRHRRLHGNSLVTSRDSAAAIFCLQEARWGEWRESPPHRRRRKRRRWVKAPPTTLPPPAPPPPTPPPLLVFSQWKISKLAVSATGTKGIIASYYGEGEEEVQSQEWSCEIMWQQLPFFCPCCNAFIFWGNAEMYVTTAACHPQPATAAVPDPNNQQKGDKAIKCTGEKRRKNTAWLQTVFYLKQRSFQKSPCFSRSK